MAVSWSPACHLRNVRCPVSGTTTRPSPSAWVAGARQATRPLVRRCSPFLAGLDDRHYGGGRQPTGLTANTPLRRLRSRAGAACSLSPPSPLLAAASEEGVHATRGHGRHPAGQHHQARLAAVISDRQPDVLIAKTTTRCRRHIGVLPLPKATPGRLRSAAISLPAGSGTRRATAFLFTATELRVQASDRRDRTNRSELRSWNGWWGSNRRSSDYEPDARRRPGRIWSDLACSRWAPRRSRRLPTDPEGSSG